MSVVGKHLLFGCWIRQKSEPSDAIATDSLAVDHCVTANQVPQVVPIEVPAIPKLLHQLRRIESISRLPELQHHEAANEWLVERSRGEHAEIVDVAGLVPLITGADFLGNDFGQREADDVCGRKGQ